MTTTTTTDRHPFLADDLKTLTDLHEELQADGLHIIDFITALCETADSEEAAERCVELSSAGLERRAGGDMDRFGGIIKRIEHFGL